MEKKEYYKPLPVNRKLNGLKKSLRNNATPEEGILWNVYLKKFEPSFHRQGNIGNYIVDFHCPNLRMIIEVDGSQHYTEEAKAYDKARSAYLNQLGYVVVRFDNYDVKHRIIEVCDTIIEVCDTILYLISVVAFHSFPFCERQHTRPPPGAGTGSVCWRSGQNFAK